MITAVVIFLVTTIFYFALTCALIFFVLFAVQKSEKPGLKIFGNAIAITLAVCSVIIFITGVSGVLARQGMMNRQPPVRIQRMQAAQQQKPVVMEKQMQEQTTLKK